MTTTLVLAFAGAVVGGSTGIFLKKTFFKKSKETSAEVFFSSALAGAALFSVASLFITYGLPDPKSIQNLTSTANTRSIEGCINRSMEEEQPVIVTYTRNKTIISCRPA